MVVVVLIVGWMVMDGVMVVVVVVDGVMVDGVMVDDGVMMVGLFLFLSLSLSLFLLLLLWVDRLPNNGLSRRVK